jgi:uncharacterized protein (TIGR02453 family)
VFAGFSPIMFEFLSELRINNNTIYFHEHEAVYKQYYVKPAVDFIEELGNRLKKRYKNLVCIPKVNGSLYRINRDIRFSGDKSPYKTHLGMVLWNGPFAVKHENPGFYVQLEPGGLTLIAGSWYFTPNMLAKYREALLDEKLGEKFTAVINELKANHMELASEMKLKTVPKGFNKEHPLAEYAKYKGIYTLFFESDIPDIVFQPEFVDYAEAFFKKTFNFFDWISDLAYISPNT